MKIIIKEREYNYTSDYPHGWMYSSGDYFKGPVEIGIYKCFIKRFEKKNPERIAGWQLLHSLKGKHENNLPRIHDIISTTEKGKSVYYVFYEFIEGDTLDKMISRYIEINLEKLTNDLFNALQSLQRKGYWFADFCEKNIFCEKGGRFLLVDLDSAQPILEKPNSNIYANKEYWSFVFNFYKNILRLQNFRPSDLSGISLNYLQVIFLILRLKLFNQDAESEYNSGELFDYLPTYLNDLSFSFKEIFIKVFQNKEFPLQFEDVVEIKSLIKEKIIDATHSPHLNESAISEFTANNYFKKNGDNYIIENGKTFTLNWEIKNATKVELYKNGNIYRTFSDTKKKHRT